MSAQTPVEGIDPEVRNSIDGNTPWQSEKRVASDEPEHAVYSQTKQKDVPPDGGYGWVCVVGAFLEAYIPISNAFGAEDPFSS